MNGIGHKSVFSNYRTLRNKNDDGMNAGKKEKCQYLSKANELKDTLAGGSTTSQDRGVRQKRNILNTCITQIQRDLNDKKFRFDDIVISLCGQLDINMEDKEQAKSVSNFVENVAYLAKHDTTSDTKINWFSITNKTDHISLLLNGTKCHNYLTLHMNDYRVQYQIKVITENLDGLAKIFFKNLLEIPEIGSIDKISSPILSGDLDGSHARLLLLGIQAGKITLGEEHLKKLCDILNAEAYVINNLALDKLKAYQSNNQLQKKLQDICNNITYCKNTTPLIFEGDCVHDRFCLDKVAEMQLRTDLKKRDPEHIIFIKGNHDVYSDHENSLNSKSITGKLQTGYYAHKGELTKKDFISHENHIFQNSYYHKESETLHLHNGFEQKGPNTIGTAFGDIVAKDISGFVEQVNKKTYKDVQKTSHQNMTSYRPETATVTSGILKRITIVHGHHGNNNIKSFRNGNKPPVLNLNARENQNNFAVAAVRFGKIFHPRTASIILNQIPRQIC